jgi:uncharacterized protein
VACRTVRPKRDLIRVVRGPDGILSLDPTGRSAGRGAYVCRTADGQRIAVTKGALARALHRPLSAELQTVLAAEITTDINEGGARGQE